MAEGEVVKLQNHLSLLREEYVKLQTRLAEVERKYQIATANSKDAKDQDNFVGRLLKTVADLFNKERYSDLLIKLEGSRELHGHRFILAARSDYWGVPDLSQVSCLDFSGIKYEVAFELMKWAYTDSIDIKTDDVFLLELLRAATKFKLRTLQQRCENGLMSFVNMKNCIRFYQTAEEIGAGLLKEHCSELISNHWNDFTSEDFATMPAPLLYKMFKTKTDFPLHATIRAKREDALFLYLMEFDAKLNEKLNEVDEKGDLPLDLALSTKQTSIAETLIKHRVDVNKRNNSGKCLIHIAIKRGDEYSASFLIQHHCDVNMTTHLDKESPLHMTANFCPDVTSPEVIDGMATVCNQLIANGADVNHQDSSGCTPLHCAVFSRNQPVLTQLLDSGKLQFELKNNDGHTALWLALQQAESGDGDAEKIYGPHSFAAQLLAKGSSPDAVEPETGNSLLHLSTIAGNERAGIFLANSGANVNLSNRYGETALHHACHKGLTKLVEILLRKGANPNTQTEVSSRLGVSETDPDTTVTRQTPLHLALINRNSDIVEIFLQHKVEAANSGDAMKVWPNFNLKDSEGQTVLGMALWHGLHGEAARLLGAGANINEKNLEGFSLLHQSIERQDTKSALFLIEHKADLNMKYAEYNRTNASQTPLRHAIQRHLPVVVETLCKRGVNLNELDEEKCCPLWQALDTGQEDIAEILVKYGCDLDLWSEGPEGCEQTLLHKALDENNEAIACFLIKSGCDKNAFRRPGPNGEGGDEARKISGGKMDLQTPLHMACTWGLELVVQCLMEHGAEVNVQDIEGKAPIHIAIENQHAVIISLLLSHPGLDLNMRDKNGLTPFAVAMTRKNNKAAQAILDREPTAAEQVDNRGRNFLHTAIQQSDIESVLFLIGVRANVNSHVQDSQKLTPLHLAVTVGSEIIVRNLILAGADVNAKTRKNETSLHLAASKDHSSICSVLLENGIDFSQVDENLNNALHVAVYNGNVKTVRVLLTESSIDAEAVNAKGQNSLHVLAQYGKDSAAAIFDLFRESMPNYPIDKPDADGNTALLLAYINGNGSLCRSLVRAGACLGSINKQGISIFNAPVATKQLLFKLLDMLSKEPAWVDGEICLECGAKFGLKTRKHHCRHCGRLVCAKCSSKDMPIVKYNLSKPVRVCDICFDVLSLGGAF